MGKVLIIRNADFSQNAIDRLTPVYDKVSIIVDVTPVGGGTVTGGGLYDVGDTVQLSATPNTGYEFVSWSDGNTSATRTITVGLQSQTYTAQFRLVYVTISDFDVSKVEKTKYASGHNGVYFYYNTEQAAAAGLSTDQQISYIIPYKLKVGSRVVIQINENWTRYSRNFGAIHDFSAVPENLLPTGLLNADYHSYQELPVTEPTRRYEFVVQEGFQYVELYLYSYNPDYIYPYEISELLDYIIVEPDYD